MDYLATANSLQVPKIGKRLANSPEVSTGSLNYSRFLEVANWGPFRSSNERPVGRIEDRNPLTSSLKAIFGVPLAYSTFLIPTRHRNLSIPAGIVPEGAPSNGQSLGLIMKTHNPSPKETNPEDNGAGAAQAALYGGDSIVRVVHRLR